MCTTKQSISKIHLLQALQDCSQHIICSGVALGKLCVKQIELQWIDDIIQHPAHKALESQTSWKEECKIVVKHMDNIVFPWSLAEALVISSVVKKHAVLN